MGSLTIAAWVARIAFPTLVIVGRASGDLGPKTTTAFVLLGLAVWLALPHLVANGAGFVTPGLAVLDIALVLIVFKGDVAIT